MNTPETPLRNEKMLELEKSILHELEWNLNVPTMNNWLGMYTSDFDTFLQKKGWHDYTYREPGESHFRNLNDLNQMMDCVSLSSETYK